MSWVGVALRLWEVGTRAKDWKGCAWCGSNMAEYSWIHSFFFYQLVSDQLPHVKFICIFSLCVSKGLDNKVFT